MTLDAAGTLALMRELRRFQERGCVADARLVFEALQPSLAQLDRRETWTGDEAQTHEAFALMAWLASERETRPFVVPMPAWLANWVVTTHRPIPAPARASFSPRPAARTEGDAERDPIDVAVLGVILSGASLILAIETKVKARQAAETQAAAQRAAAANRIRLRSIGAHMDELRRFLGNIRERGRLVLNPAKPGLTRTSIVFASSEAEEQFNQDFDRLTALIGRVNRALSEIDPRGLPLEPADVQRLVEGPIAVAEAKLGALLRPEVGPNERIDKAADLIADYAALAGNLASALESRP